MKIPTAGVAEKLLLEGERLNPGQWAAHSRYAATAAKNIAAACPGMDPEAAYAMGLLHDIGRREGPGHLIHVMDGYRYLQSLGYEDGARICLTHSFFTNSVKTYLGNQDCSPEDHEWLAGYISHCDYDDYDKLLQLCDALALPQGFCVVEKRMVDVTMRYGFKPYTLDKWKAIFDRKAYFDSKTGGNIYALLPGIEQSTFGY